MQKERWCGCVVFEPHARCEARCDVEDEGPQAVA